MKPAAAERGEFAHRQWLIWWVSRTFCLLFGLCYFRLRWSGRRHVPRRGPVILCANHVSYLDPMLLGSVTPRYILYLTQSGLAKNRLLAWWLSKVGTVLIDRDAPSKDALRILADHLKAGGCVCVFAEGTRSRDGTVGPFKNGLEFLVRRTGAIVVPIGVAGANRAFPRGAVVPRPFAIAIRIGAAVAAEQVLAEGGVARLRREVARLCGLPLREESESPTGSAPAPVDNQLPTARGEP